MDWIKEAIEPEEPEGCDLCVRVAQNAPQGQIIVLPVVLPCGSVTPAAFHTYQLN